MVDLTVAAESNGIISHAPKGSSGEGVHSTTSDPCSSLQGTGSYYCMFASNSYFLFRDEVGPCALAPFSTYWAHGSRYLLPQGLQSVAVMDLCDIFAWMNVPEHDIEKREHPIYTVP